MAMTGMTHAEKLAAAKLRMPHRMCQAHRRRTDPKIRCRNWAMRGATVCRYHGGKAAQVRAKAKGRLALMSDAQRERLVAGHYRSIREITGMKVPKDMKLPGAP